MNAKSRYAGVAVGVVVLLAAGILIGRGTSTKAPDAGALTAGSPPRGPGSPAEAGSPDTPQARPDRQPPLSREEDDDRLRGGWGTNDDTQGAQDQQVGTPGGRTKGPASGGRSRPPRGQEAEPEGDRSKPEPEHHAASDAVNA